MATDQSVTTLGIKIAGSANDSAGATRFFTETAMIAFATGLVYIITGSYQLGYQDQFGFTYISLGVEDVIGILREFLIPLLIGACSALIITFIVMFVRKTDRADRLINVFIFFLPLSICVVFFVKFGQQDHLALVDNETYWLLIAFYLFDPNVWRYLNFLFNSSDFTVPRDYIFRTAQLAVVSLLLTVLSYDIGVIDARNIHVATKCPDFDKRQSIMIQMTRDLAICAETDFQSSEVKPNMFYFKIPDNGNMQVFSSVRFHPEYIDSP